MQLITRNMFQKPFKVKSHTLVKKSERKKLHDELLQGNTNLNKKVLEDLLPLKGDLGVIKLITHSSGEVLVYTNKKIPYFFTYQQRLIPTVYASWKHPDFVVSFNTHEYVFSRLQSGADLMLPGVMVPKGGFKPFDTDQPSFINLVSNKAAVAVGITNMSNDKISQEGIKTGRLVTVLHCYEDLLWQLGDKSKLPSIPAESVEQDEDDCDKGDAAEVTNKMNSQLKVTEENEVRKDAEDKEEKVLDDDNNEDEVEEDIYQHESIPDSMDDLLRMCFLYAVKRYGKEIKFPLLTNLFYKNFMITCCPKDHPLNVKKSSYKKLSTFLCDLKDEGMIELEQLSKGVEAISSIDFNHSCIKTFEIPSWELYAVIRDEEDDNEDEDWLHYEPPTFSPVYLLTSPVLPILNCKEKNFSKGDVLTGNEAKEKLTEYVKHNNLNERSFVKLDIALSQNLLNKNDYSSVLSWADLTEAFYNKMTKAHLVEQPGKNSYIEKGNIKKIKFDVKQKGSNKKLTEIANLEVYGIDAKKLASYVQRSISCNAFVTSTDDKSRASVLCAAGNQIHVIEKILIEKYHLAQKHMTGLEKAAKKKKSKK